MLDATTGFGAVNKKKFLYKMDALTIETFKTDKITAISVDDKSSGEFNYKSVSLYVMEERCL